MIWAAWRWIATSRAGRAVGAVLAALAGIWLYGRHKRSQGITEAERKQREQEFEAHDRINNAETGLGMSDDKRREWLRRKADEWDGN